MTNIADYAFVYKPMTLGEVIDALKAADPDMTVPGMSPVIISYRGYYERPSVEPEPSGDSWWTARELAEAYEGYIGQTMYGYKGGAFEIRAEELLYIAEYGREGHVVAGFQALGSVLRPVVVEERFYY